jgi:hypothetical protein
MKAVQYVEFGKPVEVREIPAPRTGPAARRGERARGALSRVAPDVDDRLHHGRINGRAVPLPGA